MTTDGSPAGSRRVRRIILALDTQSGDLASMEQALALAARLHGELIALYVEDIDLVRLAEHRSISAYSTVLTTRRELATGLLRDQLRLQGARLRREVERAAARRQVKCAFEVRQGRLLAEALGAAGDDDLVVVRWSGAQEVAPPWASSAPASAVVQALAEAQARSVLLLHPKTEANGPVFIAFDGSETSRHALQVAAQVADRDGALVEVGLLTSRAEQATAWGAEIASAFIHSRITFSLLHLPTAYLGALTEMASRRRSALLVLGADRAVAEADASRLLRRLSCSVLLVR